MGPRFVAAAAFASLVSCPAVAGYGQQYTVALWSVTSIDPDPGDCVAQVAAVREALVRLNVPAARPFNLSVSRQFSWVVVCDEWTWFRLKQSPRYARVNTNTGMTDFPHHEVFLNGFRRDAASLQGTVAHEMGHMLCQCDDESQADRWKSILMRPARQERTELATVDR